MHMSDRSWNFDREPVHYFPNVQEPMHYFSNEQKTVHYSNQPANKLPKGIYKKF